MAKPKVKPGPGRRPGLTDKREAFIREYCLDMNATQAAIRAVFSAKTARSSGNRMLKNADIQARIKAIQEDKAERSELTADGILKDIQRLKELAESKWQTASAIRAA